VIVAGNAETFDDAVAWAALAQGIAQADEVIE
jgi:hypothetical protein